MGNSTWTIIGLVALIIGTLIAFPERLDFILKNKLYMMISGLSFFLILFFIWLRTRSNY